MQDWTLENGNGVGVARMVDYRRPQVHSGPQTLQLLVDDVETVDAHLKFALKKLRQHF
jgi:hypothetical protein